MPSEEEMWGLAPTRNYRNLHLLVREGAGVFFDDTSPYWDYDFDEFLPLNFTPGDSLKGIDANTVERYHYLTPDELTWARVTYKRDASGKWQPASAISYGREQSSDFGNFLKFAAPIFLMAIPGVGAAIGSAAFGAAGVAVSPAVASAVGNLAVSTALRGGDIKSAIISQLASMGGGVTGGFVGRAVDSAAIGSAVAAATTAAATGGDYKQALLSSLAQSGVSAMSDFDFGSFFDLTQSPADAAPDWLAPSSGGGTYDSSVFDDYYAGGLTAADFNGGIIGTPNYNDGLWQPDPMLQSNVGYHDPVYTENDSMAIPGGFIPTGYHDPVYTENDALTPDDTNYGVPTSWYQFNDPTFADFGTVNTYGGGNAPVTTTPINTPPQTPINQQQNSAGDWLGSIVTGVTALAAAAMKLIPTIQALKNSDVIKSGTTTGTGNIVTANNNGTITQRNGSTGQTTTSIPPVGQAYQTPDGNIITNNGNGTYTVIRPDGTRFTGQYSSNSTGGVLTGGAPASSDKVILYAGLGLAAILLLKGK